MLRAYFTDRNIRRAFVLAVFIAFVVFFRHLLFLFVFFVVFHRLISLGAGYLSQATRLAFKWSVLVTVTTLVGGITALVYASIETVRHNFGRVEQGVDVIITTIRTSPIYLRARHAGLHVTTDELMTHARHHTGEAVHWAGEIGRGVLYLIIALIFSVVFLLERDDLETWRLKMPIDSVGRTMLRFIGYLADAIAITLKLQIIVALVNTIITLPILILLRLPGIPALVALMLVTGLIPVVGGPAAGVVLMTLAYVTRGPGGLIAFIVSTFVLHKIESYYLNPRLTSKHVKLPGFVIITSVVLFEQAIGLRGLFLSFPSLYVIAKIREGWVDPEDDAREEAVTTNAMRGVLPRLTLRPPPPRMPEQRASGE